MGEVTSAIRFAFWSEMHEELKRTLQALSQALQELHRDLLMLEARLHQTETGQQLGPYELLHASLHDPKFSWLRLMSAMIVHIDTIVDEVTTLSSQDASQIATEVLALIEKPSENKSQEFWNKYTSHLNNPDTIMRHSKVKEILESLAPKM